jgi:hypothetical protein
MHIIRLRILGFLIVMIGLTSCEQKKQPSTVDKDIDGWKTFETADYSIRYPGTWDFDNSGQNGVIFQIFSSQTSADDNFRENVNLVIQDLSVQKVENLDQYTQLSESQIKTMMTNSVIISSDRFNRGGQEYQKVIFTADQGQFNLKFEQYYLIRGDLAYALTLTCVADKFDGFQEVGEKILDSFKTKK